MIDILVPSPGESISEVEIGSWLVENGTYVQLGQEIAIIETEKATLEVTAPEKGRIEILVEVGTRIKVGTLIGRIDPTAKDQAGKVSPISKESPDSKGSQEGKEIKVTPVAKEMMKEHNLSIEDVINGLRRITRQDVEGVINAGAGTPIKTALETSGERAENRKKMSLLRSKLSERLVAVKNETAMLTTFNEIDMSGVIELRNTYKMTFEKQHGVKLGFMSFFTLAATRALQAFPQVNSQIDGEEIVSYSYVDIGIAVQTPKGLMVPVLRNTQTMNLAQIEHAIAEMAIRARDNRISLEDLRGGTFSISNGGVFGSLLSTPILNPPQPAILGMHNIVDRPVALNGLVVIRPMMYVALSYDHRLIDGKDSVGFLKAIKGFVENPMKLLDPDGEPERNLLGL